MKQGPTIERISVSVVIGHRLSVAEVAQIEDTVAATVGALPARGDRVTVFSREFYVQEPEEITTTEELPEYPWLVLIIAGFSVALLMGYLIARLRRRRREESAIDLVVDDTVGETAAAEELSPEEIKRREREEFILELARTQPRNMVALLRTWLSED